jgi:hypothetical protein
VAWSRDHHCSASLFVPRIGLCGQFSHDPFTDRDRAAITICPVVGPPAPPTDREGDQVDEKDGVSRRLHLAWKGDFQPHQTLAYLGTADIIG